MSKDTKNKVKPEETGEESPFVFRFAMSGTEQTGDPNSAFPETIAELLRSILDVACLTQDGKEVQVNGFRFTNSPDVHDIFRD